jgi:multidrug efflux pump subunit AcrB
VAYQLPPGTPLERTNALAAEARKIVEEQPEVETVIEINGLNLQSRLFCHSNSRVKDIVFAGH